MTHTQLFPFIHLNYNAIKVMLILSVFWTMIALRCNVVLSIPKATELDSSNSDTKEFWLEGDLGHFGGPKFKVSKNSDGGYSFELGYGGYQIELGYREKDNEVTFKITDAKNDFAYKGSIKHRPSITKKSNVVYIELFNDGDGDGDGIPHLGSTNIPLDSKFTIDSYKEKAGKIYPVDMHIIKIDYRNTFSRVLQGPLYRMVRDAFRVKDPFTIDGYIRLAIDQGKVVRSKLDFVANIHGNYFSSSDGHLKTWVPAVSVVTGSLKDVAIEKPTHTDMNAKMSGVLVIEESVMFKDNGIRYFPKRIQVLKILPQKEMKTKIAIECFVKENGGRGNILSLEAMNVETNHLVGGINARRLTQDKLLVESTFGELNSRLTIHKISKEKIRVFIAKGEDSNGSQNVKLFESIVGAGKHQTKLYRDYFFTKNSIDGEVFDVSNNSDFVWDEESLSQNEKYRQTLKLQFVTNNRTWFGDMSYKGEDLNVLLCSSSNLKDILGGNKTIRKDENIGIEVKPRTKLEDELNLKISYNKVRIFDGWYHLTGVFMRHIKKRFPDFLDRKIEHLTQMHKVISSILSR